MGCFFGGECFVECFLDFCCLVPRWKACCFFDFDVGLRISSETFSSSSMDH